MTQTDDLKRDARAFFDAAVTAADPALALRKALLASPFPKPMGRTLVIAIGKAAPRMMAEALAHIDGPYEALAVTHHENDMDVDGATVLRAGHPVPDEAGANAAKKVMAVLATATVDDQVIALISGGGSALVPAPKPPMSLADKAAVNKLLLGGGLDIVKMNLVRQQLSELKGGGFLRHAAPAPVTAYILSDVIGDDLRAIASGPTVGPIGTRSEARAILEGADLWAKLPDTARGILEQPDEAQETPDATNILIGSNRHSIAAMEETATSAGYAARVVSDALEGDVDDAAQEVIAAVGPVDQPTALLFGGETTVVLRGDGRGGRNQELALRVAMHMPKQDSDWVFLSGGTDGRDGPTDAAGGIVDAGTKDRIIANGHDPKALLDNNDSYAALDAAGDLLITPATGTNVADVQVLLIRP